MNFDIYELLEKFRPRPAMYLGKNSITRLNAFLGGYWTALYDFKIQQNETPSMQGFHDWVAMKLGYYESTSGWANMLLESENGDEEKALEKFFTFLDEYKQKKAKVIYEVNLPLPQTPKVWRIKIIDGKEIPEPPPKLMQIIKYTADKGVFIRYIGDDDNIIEEKYWQDLNTAFQIMSILSPKIDKSDWRKIED